MDGTFACRRRPDTKNKTYRFAVTPETEHSRAQKSDAKSAKPLRKVRFVATVAPDGA